MPTPPYRIALYSHDTMGMGHMRRNALIARAFADAFPGSSTLLICGALEAGAIELPPGADCLTLPALRKDADGAYESRRLDVSMKDATHIRGRAIRATLDAFAPHALIVDKVPRGAGRELESTLRAARARGRTRCVLGLRDILDEPVATRREWLRHESEEAIRDYYDAIWIYGDPLFFDPGRAYGFSTEVTQKIRHTGFLDQRTRLASANAQNAPQLPAGRLMLCMVGGGEDGATLAEAFARAEFPAGTTGVIVTGPFMPEAARARLQEIADQRTHLTVLGFLVEPAPLIARADRIVTMGGYNAIGDVLSHEKHALVVPRVRPRQEQLLRAERLRELGLADMLHPDELSAERLTAWLAAPRPALITARTRVDFGGLRRLPALLEELLSAPRARNVGAMANRGESLVAY